MDGVIIDTEQEWNDVRRAYSARWGGRWTDDDQRAVMGHNSRQWAAHIRERFEVPASEDEIIGGVVELLLRRYDEQLQLLPGVADAVRRLAGRCRLAVASSSPLAVIRHVLHATRLEDAFPVVVSSDEVAQGKPAPDVYLTACGRLGVDPALAVAVEDSSNGICAAHNAGMRVIALPNRHFAPAPEALALAARVIGSAADLTPELVEAVARGA